MTGWGRGPGLGNEESEDRTTDETLRLQVYLAHAGVASRRASEKLIQDGRVRVNGVVVTVLGEKVRLADDVRLDGLPVKIESRFRYIALNKPPEYLCSSSDPQGRRLALDLLDKGGGERLYNVGRLDYRSSGLVLFTNDGDFTAQIGHPRSGIEKEYLVEASGVIPDEFLDAFRQGITIEDIRYQAGAIERLGRKAIRVVLVEGKNREIRRVFSHFHLHPSKLHRILIGPVLLGELGEGASRALTPEELRGLGMKKQE
jgi:23S rRNA pseudouridine2605 synthase